MPFSHLNRTRKELRDDALDALHEAIAALEESGRELSRGEKMYLVSAFACFAIGNYALAEMKADLALSSSTEECRLQKVLDNAQIPDINIEELKSVLDDSRSQPLVDIMLLPFGQVGRT